MGRKTGMHPFRKILVVTWRLYVPSSKHFLHRETTCMTRTLTQTLEIRLDMTCHYLILLCLSYLSI